MITTVTSAAFVLPTFYFVPVMYRRLIGKFAGSVACAGHGTVYENRNASALSRNSIFNIHSVRLGLYESLRMLDATNNEYPTRHT